MSRVPFSTINFSYNETNENLEVRLTNSPFMELIDSANSMNGVWSTDLQTVNSRTDIYGGKSITIDSFRRIGPTNLNFEFHSTGSPEARPAEGPNTDDIIAIVARDYTRTGQIEVSIANNFRRSLRDFDLNDFRAINNSYVAITAELNSPTPIFVSTTEPVVSSTGYQWFNPSNGELRIFTGSD